MYDDVRGQMYDCVDETIVISVLDFCCDIFLSSTSFHIEGKRVTREEMEGDAGYSLLIKVVGIVLMSTQIVVHDFGGPWVVVLVFIL